MALTQNIIFAADITLPSGTYSSGTYLGKPSDPQIIHADGDVHFSGTMSGDGILVVNGNLTLSGQFTFRGIIIVYGKSSIQTDIVGQGTVYGSTICVGTDVDIKAAGNAGLFYSSQAINNKAQIMEGNTTLKREELLEACQDLRLPVAGNEKVETLELYIQTAYDEFEKNSNLSSDTSIDLNYKSTDEGIDYGSIGDKSWRFKYLINKILFFL